MPMPNTSKSDLQQTLNRIAEDLPPDRLAQLVDYAQFMKALAERERQPMRTPDQLQAIEQLFAGPKHEGPYEALMCERAEERGRV